MPVLHRDVVAVRRRAHPRRPRGGRRHVAFSAIGTTAEIREAGRYPDGRYDLLVVGTGRFAVEEVTVGERAVHRCRRDAPRRRGRRRRRGPPPREPRHPQVRPLPRADPAARGRVDATRSTSASRSRPRTPTSAEGDPERSVAETIGEVEVEQGDETVRRRVVIPDDPTTLSYLLAGIIQIELPRRQALLESETTDERLRDLLDADRPRDVPAAAPAAGLHPDRDPLGKRGS